MQDGQTLTLTVTRDEALMIFDLLMDQPYRRVAPLVQRLMDEANTPAAPESPLAAFAPARGAGSAGVVPSPAILKAYDEAFST